MAPPTAYMLFCNENRDAVRQKLASEGHEKIPVTLVAKELGQLWKKLTDDERAAYKARADEQMQQHREQQQQQQAGGGADREGEQQGEPPQQTDGGADKVAALPIGWIRRVVGLDPEIRRCSAEALQALSGVADVFLGAVCSKATATAAQAKRRTVRLDDVERCVRGDKRLVAAGVTAVMAMVNAAAAAAAEENKGGPPGKKPRVEKNPTGPARTNLSIERAFGLVQ